MQKLVSIIIPIYNTREYLRKCFDSVLAQIYKNWELILVDDGSEDGSSELCDEYAKEDTRIRVIHQKNAGNMAARRAGLEKAKGDYVCFLDSDDWMEADAVSCMYNHMESKNVEAVFLSCYKDYEGRMVPWEHKFEEGIYSRSTYLIRNMFYYQDSEEYGVLPVLHGKMFRREKIKRCFEEISDEVQIAEDRLAMFWIILNSEKIYLGNEKKYHYVFREDSIVNSTDEKFLIKVSYFYIAAKRLFEREVERDWLLKQLDYYLVNSVVGGINSKLGLSTKNLLRTEEFPYHIASKDSRIVLYGAGAAGKLLHTQIEENEYWTVEAWVDKNAREYKEMGLPVKEVEYLKQVSQEVKIIVAVRSKDLYENICEELNELGIDRNRIAWCKEKRKGV